ncbi:EF-hand domain-containing protein [Sphingomonas sanxanigenens]|uniref:EF-hand domain-containing protein n=1 Tax=Sphingomonas sanxanigenens DSM 19645 = NX02 TaxID=1123269 RepID=W0AKX4_9SPHN|nr:EF-hand domain-containing protein [Sphingomonas sanxanigenens]AHE56340.1 hypothetical protein NX02_23630 [Sphingomonas sanxanigenens DSM 19645 = NX02]
MKKMILFGALGATLLGSGLAVAQPAERPGRDADWTRTEMIARADKQFAKLDTNGDGKITADERAARKDARLEARFQRLDADRNGSVTLAEMKAADAQRGEKRAGRGERDGQERGGRHGMRRGHHGRGGPGGMMMRADADKDGVITKAEFQAPMTAMFDKLDTDRNGVVTKAERDAARATWKAREPKRS